MESFNGLHFEGGKEIRKHWAPMKKCHGARPIKPKKDLGPCLIGHGLMVTITAPLILVGLGGVIAHSGFLSFFLDAANRDGIQIPNMKT